MIVAGALLLYAVLASSVGRRCLEKAKWPVRAPVVGICAWQALSFSVAGTLVLSALVLSLPVMPFQEFVAQAMEACSLALVSHYETPGGAPLAWVALALGLIMFLRPAALFAGDLVMGVLARRRQRQRLRLVGTTDGAGVTTIQHELPLIYCLPGRRSRIVVTSGAQRRLTEQQLRLVVGHEQAHLRARHHWALTAAHSLARGFRPLSVFSRAEAAIAALAEMHADDAAAVQAERRDLARALLVLSPHAGAFPAATLSSAGIGPLDRARRLCLPPGHLRLRGVVTAGLVGVLVLALPLLLALGPGVESAVRDCCHAASAVPVQR